MYEMRVVKPSKVFIDAVLCEGGINIYTSQNLETLQNGGFEHELKYVYNKQLMALLPVKYEGSLYLGAKSIFGKQSEDHGSQSLYKLKSTILDKDSVLPFNIL